uniref:Uncharacterized protein n=1 Tax=Physcomitrium patens TaxID=3218 RepID=A0A7I4E830_PHYPA
MAMGSWGCSRENHGMMPHRVMERAGHLFLTRRISDPLLPTSFSTPCLLRCCSVSQRHPYMNVDGNATESFWDCALVEGSKTINKQAP